MLLGALPWRSGQRLGAVIGRLLWWARSRMARTTLANVELCFPELAPSARRRLARASLEETGRLLLETAGLWGRHGARWQDLLGSIDGRHIVDEVRNAGSGVLVLAPHFGNWELLNFFLGNAFEATVLYEPPQDPRLEALLKRSRSRHGSRPVPTTPAGIRSVLRTLRQSGVVGLLPDQVPERESGIHVSFFGVPALTMTLVHRLLIKTSARAVVGAAIRRSDGRFDLVFESPAPDIYDADVEIATRAVNAAVESMVRRDCKQYQWEYKRFKREPTGSSPRYPPPSP